MFAAPPFIPHVASTPSADVTAPTITSLTVDEPNSQVEFTLDEAATITWQVDDTASYANAAAMDAASGSAYASGTFGPVSTGGIEEDIDLSAVAAGSHYMHVYATDAASNDSAVSSTSYTQTTEPGQFGTSDWALADAEDTGKLTVTISSLPTDNGSTITDVEYDLDSSGSWVSSGGTSGFTISGLTDDTEYDVRLRAVNANGAGTASAVKSATPTAASGGGTTPTVADTAAGAQNTGTGLYDFTLPTAAEGDTVLMVLASDNAIQGSPSADTGIGYMDAATQGWTVIAGGNSAVPNPGHLIATKVMGATPDTTVEVFIGGSRGVTATFVTIENAGALDNGVESSSGASGMPTAPAYTTTFDDSLRVIVGLVDDTNDTMTAPSGYTDAVTEDLTSNAGASTIIAFKDGGTAGSDTPAVFGGSLSDEWIAYHFAFKAG